MTSGDRAAVWRSWALLGLLLVGTMASSASAQALQAVPAPTSHVMDLTNTLPAAARDALEQKLTAFEADRGTQIGVLVVPTTAPEDIFSYANRVANSWKLGRKEVGDGLLVVVAKDDRKLRIEVAKTLEGAIPDLMAKRVIDQAMTPAFKQGDYAGGLDAGVEQLMGLVRGEALPTPATVPPAADEFQLTDFIVFLFIATAIGGSMARQRFGNRWGSVLTGACTGLAAWWGTNSLVIGAIAVVVGGLLSLLGAHGRGRGTGGSGSGGWAAGSSHSSSWSSGSSSRGGSGGSGSFSSGGGGNFGGGGASGGW
jgi:uncharacterized protein